MLRTRAIGVGLVIAAPVVWTGPTAVARATPITVTVSGYSVTVAVPGGDVEVSSVGNQVTVAPGPNSTGSTVAGGPGCSKPQPTTGAVLCNVPGPPAIVVVGTPGDETVSTLDVTGAATVSVSLGAGQDTFTGGAVSEIVDGGDGDDILAGGGGADELEGGAGDDTVTGDKGADSLNGGVGDDLLETLDKEVDVVRCGAGNDISKSDWNDTFPDIDCETLARTEDPAKPTPVPTALPSSAPSASSTATATTNETTVPTMGPNPVLVSSVFFRSKWLRVGPTARQTRVAFGCTAGLGCAGTLSIKVHGKLVARGSYTAAGGTRAVAELRVRRKSRVLLYQAKGQAEVIAKSRLGTGADTTLALAT